MYAVYSQIRSNKVLSAMWWDASTVDTLPVGITSPILTSVADDSSSMWMSVKVGFHTTMSLQLLTSLLISLNAIFIKAVHLMDVIGLPAVLAYLNILSRSTSVGVILPGLTI